MIHTVKGFGIVNQAEIDVFLELSCFFDDPIKKNLLELIYNIILVSDTQKSDSDFHSFSDFLPYKSYYRTLSRVPCAIQ